MTQAVDIYIINFKCTFYTVPYKAKQTNKRANQMRGKF